MWLTVFSTVFAIAIALAVSAVMMQDATPLKNKS
jgi:hypothetical protein